MTCHSLSASIILAALLLTAMSSGQMVSAQNNGGTPSATDDGYSLIKDIPYTTVNRVHQGTFTEFETSMTEEELDAQKKYKDEICRLDLYYPDKVKDYATLVWYHGGGLTGGEKELLKEFRQRGFAVVSVDYRLYPRTKCPGYLEDAAQALAWTFDHISEYGGDPGQIYVSGHSAGGYLTFMLALAKKYTAAYGLDADRIAKAYPISGQTTTHFTIRKERGLDTDIPIIDEYAPSNNVRTDGAPLLMITGDRSLEMLARWEENAHILSILKQFHHPAELYELQGFNHGTVLGPACYQIREDITRSWKASTRIQSSRALKRTMEVSGRQGIAADGKYYYVSGSTALFKYDLAGKLVSKNERPFEKLSSSPSGEPAPNHIGDIDVYNGEIFAGCEYFFDGEGKNIQVAVFDAKTLRYKYSIPWLSASGQVECCGLAVDKAHGYVWMADWVQGKDLYCYDLKTRNYVGKVALRNAPVLQQGICFLDGSMLISSDDGDAEKGAADHLYSCRLYDFDPTTGAASLKSLSEVSLFRTMNDFLRAGEIEGLTVDPVSGELIVMSNRGSRIILGMVRGFYPGYDHEIHELYFY